MFLILPESINRRKGRVTEMFFKLKETKDTKLYKNMKAELDTLIPIVSGFEQQDAQEFLVFFLELLDK